VVNIVGVTGNEIGSTSFAAYGDRELVDNLIVTAPADLAGVSQRRGLLYLVHTLAIFSRKLRTSLAADIISSITS
jgi:hypothetical protein